MKNHHRGLGFFFALLAGIACEDDDITPTGNLDRPSGLAYVQFDEGRGDLYIADAEAQGVLVFQLLSDPLQGGSTLVSNRQGFVRAPAVHFPLLMPAERFPTNVIAGESRAFALSSVSSKLHVLDIGASEFGLSATMASNDLYKRLAELALDDPALFDVDAFESAIPVALRLVDEDDANRDLLLVAFDRPNSSDAILAALWISGSGADIKIDSVETATLAGGGPRDLIIRSDASPVAMVSSAMSSGISIVVIDAAADKVLGAIQLVDVGGPTGKLIDAEDAGVVALRLDQAALVLLESDLTSAWRRSSRRFDTTRDLALPTEDLVNFRNVAMQADWDGRILLPSTAVTGAYGRLAALRPGRFGSKPSADMITACAAQSEWSVCAYTVEDEDRRGRCRADGDDLACTPTAHLPNVIKSADKGADGLAPVLNVVLADGTDLFLVGRSLRLAKIDQSHVLIVERNLDDGVTIDGCENVYSPLSCEVRENNRVNGGSACGSALLSHEHSTAKIVRAEYRGNIIMADDGFLAQSSTSTNTLRLTRISAKGFPVVEVGDRVRIQFHKPTLEAGSPCAALAESGVDEGQVAALGSDRLELVFADDSDIQKLLACTSGLALDYFEVFPLFGEFIVSTLQMDEQREEAVVFDRVPTSSAPEELAELGGLLNTTLRASSGFRCRVQAQVRTCASDADCGGGTCQAGTSAKNGVAACAGLCMTPCTDGSCFAVSERVCSGATFHLAPAALNSNSASTCTANDRTLLPAAPEDAVFVPNRRSWITSFPGSRALRETMVTAADDLSCAWYR